MLYDDTFRRGRPGEEYEQNCPIRIPQHGNRNDELFFIVLLLGNQMSTGRSMFFTHLIGSTWYVSTCTRYLGTRFFYHNFLSGATINFHVAYIS